jgi:hypothetical protein
MDITLGGVKYPLTFNMGFIRRVNSEYGIDLIKGANLDQTEDYFNFCYAALHCGTEGKISKEDAPKLVDEMHPMQVKQIVEAFLQWMTTPPEVAEKPSKEGGKKKSTFHPVKAA